MCPSVPIKGLKAVPCCVAQCIQYKAKTRFPVCWAEHPIWREGWQRPVKSACPADKPEATALEDAMFAADADEDDSVVDVEEVNQFERAGSVALCAAVAVAGLVAAALLVMTKKKEPVEEAKY